MRSRLPEMLDVVARYKGVDVGRVALTMSLEELDIDSLEAVDILWELEQLFGRGIPLSAEDVRTAATLGDVFEAIIRVLDAADGDAE